MQAKFEDVKSRQGNQSYVAYGFSVPGFEFNWHYHPEYELTLINAGQGKRLVGDSFADFAPGDLVLVGQNLPHTWESAPSTRPSEAIVVQFPPELTQPWQALPEMVPVTQLLARSASGLWFKSYPASVAYAIRSLPGLIGPARIAGLMQVLDTLTTLPAQLLASPYFTPGQRHQDEHRVNNVCRYIVEHAAQPITLTEVAAQAHLSPSAFCKFFKRTTGKTFSDYVNDVRVGRACLLLTETEQPVAEIAHQCGFESLTYFNRVFLKKKGLQPRGFRRGR